MFEQKYTAPSGAESAVRRRIEEKLGDYAKYNLSSREACLLNILFDLMQEYQAEEYLNLLPILLLEMMFDLPAELYARENGAAGGHFVLRTPAARHFLEEADKEDWLPPTDKLRGNIIFGERVCIPVRGRYADQSQDEQDREVRGLLVLYPAHPFSAHELLFLEKFANRLGFALHNNALARRDREHLDFVRNLVKDIGHNVLGPNMYFKLLLTRMASSLLDLGGQLDACRTQPGMPGAKSDADRTHAEEPCGQPDVLRTPSEEPCGQPDAYLAEELEKLRKAHLDILDQINEIQQNFNHSSLFLESLLRESHFIQGCYVLRPGRINIYERVLKAQFQNHLPLFKAKGIKAELLAPGNTTWEAGSEFEADADFGLISQVAANIFSNALKYAAVDPAWMPGASGSVPDANGSTPSANGSAPSANGSVPDASGSVPDASGSTLGANGSTLGANGNGHGPLAPFIRCGVEKDEQGQIRLYVLSSGKRIAPEEAGQLFDKYYRASNSGNISGTGKGLHFVRDIVTRHGGEAGYQATEEGNKFYFSLPRATMEVQEA